MNPVLLDPIEQPLTGSHLIEASAGTGKTFTIALLYLRLVLGPRDEVDNANFPRPLTPPDILVVTFTNAATQELRERIRERLVEAALIFQEAQALDEGDPLARLRDSYPREHWPRCARRLQLAAQWMDEAAVSTIHSWCYRMLREHAFESGSLFALNLETDQSELEAEVARDYWRSFYYPLDRDGLGEILKHWKTPQELNADVLRLRDHRSLLSPAAPPDQIIARTQRQTRQHLEALKAPWPAWLDDLEAIFEEAAGKKAFNGQRFNKKNRASWLGALRDWARDPEHIKPALSEAAWNRLTPQGMAEIWQKGEPPSHPALAALAALPEKLNALPDPHPALLAHAVHWMAARREQVQHRRAEMNHQDLLTQLDRALVSPEGDRLAAQMRRQFPVALVDEFQDTDPIQYRLFDRVYRLEDNTTDSLILLIGDPKQAIYGFRGADIHTYLQARQATKERLVTLGTNYRSSRALVEAVNRCFVFADAHPQGAFLFKGRDDNPLPFQPVAAKGRKDRLVQNGEPLPALTCWRLDTDEPLSKTAYLNEMGERCASHIAGLLNDQSAGFVQDDRLTPLAPSDLAVLVNSGNEASIVRNALDRRGIKSVYLSDKESVFQSPACTELETWLRAVSVPENDRALRAALSTPSLGLSLTELDALNGAQGRHELAWEERVLQFRGYHRLWQRQGVLPMLRRLLADFDVARRLLASRGGERQLTDLLHLGELLQEASQELDGEYALIRYLAEARAAPEQQDVHRQRLESDAALVQVITIHKSKGLEYPLVFLPFIAGFRVKEKKDAPILWHDEQGRLQLALDGREEHQRELADRERLAEDLRKLYVALTRARHATWLGLAPLKEMHRGALGHLLAGGSPIVPEQFDELLHTLRGDCEAIHIAPAPTIEQRSVSRQEQTVSLAPARWPTRPAKEHWWIASYSALRLGAYSQVERSDAFTLLEPLGEEDSASPLARPEPTTPLEATTREMLDEPTEESAVQQTGLLHRFPRGPGPGTFLHGLLEWAGRQGFGRVLDQPALMEDTLARRANLRGWSHWIPELRDWLLRLLDRTFPLPNGQRLRLAELECYQVEMEFWFATHRVDTQRLDALVSAHILPGQPRPVLEQDSLNGMLKGFIDLVFERDDRYYLLDWKSNHLGPSDDAYTEDAMDQAVLDKRYDLQYCLYLLALHRLLKSRLGAGYDYKRHIGGVLYVFLRGVDAPGAGLHRQCPPKALIEALDKLFRAPVDATTDTKQGAKA
ncbi:exodeoxyribonuclease V subunit beta [Pistricoccus aurantiacus]|uniref:exodeoxyribonuclease V subunit beta n=1 Tax=Pistricoccus aurantiacus TaxID=1883414 RepID=UPI00363A304E